MGRAFSAAAADLTAVEATARSTRATRGRTASESERAGARRVGAIAALMISLSAARTGLLTSGSRKLAEQLDRVVVRQRRKPRRLQVLQRRVVLVDARVELGHLAAVQGCRRAGEGHRAVAAV